MNTAVPGLKTTGRELGLLTMSVSILMCLCFYSQVLGAEIGPGKERSEFSTRTQIGIEKTEHSTRKFTLDEAIAFALKNNPNIGIAEKEIEIASHRVDGAWAERMPRIDFTSGAYRNRYPLPLSPPVISGPLGTGLSIPEYSRNIYDVGGSLRLPVFRGGRLHRAVKVAELLRDMARDSLATSKHELAYNVSSVFFKIAELEKLLQAADGTVRQIEAHRRDAESLFQAGTVPQLDLLKTDVRLAHALEQRLAVRNSLESAYELLANLMGMDLGAGPFEISYHETHIASVPPQEEGLAKAFSHRPELKALAHKKNMLEERIKMAQGKRLPDVSIGGEYGGRAGDSLGFKENWYFGAKLSIPVFDGGLITAEVNKERVELHKTLEEERSLKLSIAREVRNAYLDLIHARERIAVGRRSMESARENVRVERLKYQAGAGTASDYLDAQTDLLRMEADYYRAVFDEETARARLKKAIGEEIGIGGQK